MNLLDAETMDAICAGVKREPLAYEHNAAVNPSPPACTHGERPTGAGVSHYPTCPGCVIPALIRTVLNPNESWQDGQGRVMPLVEWMRREFDEFHPMRVTVERELQRRDIA